MSQLKDFQPVSGREYPRFSGIKTFFRLPVAQDTEDFDVAILGVPFDGGVSYRPGARFAPSAVREASSLGRGFHMESARSLFRNLRVADVGDTSVIPLDLAKTYEKIEARVSNLLKNGKKVFTCGGDHSITLPILRAYRKHFGKPISFVHFDAHLDTYPAAWDCEYHHGAFARHAVEEGLVNPKKMWQIGIRGPLADATDLDFSKKHGIQLHTVDLIRSQDLNSWLAQLPAFDDNPVYISFDVDCLDPAYAPGTGTPVVGGLTSYETQKIIRALKIPNLVGGDVVEICPAYDSSDITSLVGVDVLFQMMCKLS